MFSIGGDGATYDIGFGALSRLLSTKTPIKVIVVNTGVYSNTGGQASTSSLIGQDSDLARYGAAHAGKTDNRKELGLIAAFHPSVMVVQTATSIQGHFLKNVLSALSRTTSPAVIDVYTPCQGEQGIGDDVSSEHARLAVESRVSPVYVHNPDGGSVLKERFSLDGNPDVEQGLDDPRPDLQGRRRQRADEGSAAYPGSLRPSGRPLQEAVHRQAACR